MTAKEVAITPPQIAASDSVPPVTSSIRAGITGKIRPIPIASSVTVQMMKASAARGAGVTARLP
ncbi:MAG: hypothetical protein KF887_16065 [Paracoccaceae bacterium]|nr:MAG: hypothetical protein KF887_16065 [Paracoccaceae bacterium]